MSEERAPLLQRLFSLEGKVALITGASGGIGRALAVGLAEAGAAIGVHGRKREEIDKTCSLIEQAGGVTRPFVADLSVPASSGQLIADVYAEMGRLDILVNCAATNRRMPIAEVTEEDYDFIMAVNLKSVYFLTQAAHALMQAQGAGNVIHIGSINTYFGLDTVSVFGAS